MSDPTPPRSQRERREATVARLIDATIAAIGEVGYAASSTKEICRRAGVSEGGMFRHFGSRLDLVCAAAEEVGRRQIDATQRRLGREWADDPVQAAVRAARRNSRDPNNAVWFELLVAARTNPELRARLAPVVESFYARLAGTAEHTPGIRDFPEPMRAVILLSILHMIDGETLLRTVHEQSELEEQRAAMLGFLAALARNL